MNGDIVHVRYVCKDEQGNVVDDSANSDEPVCFEVGFHCDGLAFSHEHTVF